MLINTNLPVPTDGVVPDLRARTATNTTTDLQGSAPSAVEVAQNRLSGLNDQDGDSVDSASADQALGYLRANMFAQPGMLFAAQANLNPQTVYNLLN